MTTQQPKSQGDWLFDIYDDNIDSDVEAHKYLFTIAANTASEALQKASEYLQVPSYDLFYRNQRRNGDGENERT